MPIVRIRKELQDLLPKESAEHAKALTDLETLCSQAELRIEAIRKRRKLLDDLGVDVRQVRQVREPSRFREMQTRFAWNRPHLYTGMGQFRDGSLPETSIPSWIRQRKTADQAILFNIEGDPKTAVNLKVSPNATWPPDRLHAARDEKKKSVGIDAERQKKYDELQKTLQRNEATLRKLEGDSVTLAKGGAADRRKALLEQRREEYTQAFLHHSAGRGCFK